ncbi:hypothetical protein [Halomarina ordinaria]|uniref:Uncharacterized protein n=1 Tax=Halomarina ordinaria TaxID=3033939 RepID=A0ABD5U7U7_9EURY|nr:hypothetical protein [Halomarina sp. PSRA2]
MSIEASVFGALTGAVAGGLISYFVSSKVAKKQAKTQYNYQIQRTRHDWYTQANTLAELTEHDWYDVMNQSEVDQETQPADRFIPRIEELRNHAARGKSLDVNGDVVDGLEQLAADLSAALTVMGSGDDLWMIEHEMHPVIDQVREKATQRATELE